MKNTFWSKTQKLKLIIWGIFHRGVLSKVANDNGETDVISEWGYYKSWTHDPKLGSFFARPSSGAYIFRPEISEASLTVMKPEPSKTKVYESSLLTEVHTTYEGSWIHQVIKVYKDKDYIDVDYTVGPIPVHDEIGKEVVNRFRTSIQNTDTFFTDSNGREFIKRRRSHRETWDLDEFEPVAGNYYPVNAAMYIEDDNSSIAVLTDRSQGGSSQRDGHLEFMVHRRIIKDDSRGVGEALNETDSIEPYPPFGDASRRGEGLIISGTHRLIIGDKRSGAKLARRQMDRMFSPLLVYASRSPLNSPMPKILTNRVTFDELPHNVQLLTLKVIDTDSDGRKNILLRIGHAYGKEECEIGSRVATVNISEMFQNFNLLKVTEKTLTGNQDKVKWDRNKMHWNENEGKFTAPRSAKTIVKLHPMEIKTFVLLFASDTLT